MTISLRANSPFGGYLEKYTRERHARGDATAGSGGEKGELAPIFDEFSFPPRRPQVTEKRKPVTGNNICKMNK